MLFELWPKTLLCNASAVRCHVTLKNKYITREHDISVKWRDPFIRNDHDQFWNKGGFLDDTVTC